jgi:hypothetical protein
MYSGAKMLTLSDLPESCPADEAVQLIGSLAGQLGIAGDAPSLRTLRLWRAKRLLSKGGRRFTRKNLLEVIGILRLRADGMTTGAAAERCLALDEERLLLFLSAQVEPSIPSTHDYAQVTLHLLAKGILEQYHLVTAGAIVGHTYEHRTGIANTPTSLRQASARLGRLYFEEGCEDRASSLHRLLSQCMTPLRQWSPRVISCIPDAGDAVLIDPDYRVPSEDCEIIAQQAEGVSLDDLIENRLHNELTKTIAKLGDDGDAAYTAVREFIGRHPLATNAEMHELYTDPELPHAAVDFVRSLYRPVHAYAAVEGMVHRCQYCRGTIGRNGRCELPGCREDHPQSQLAEPVPLDVASVARPEVLKYWVDPAREELRLYDALRQARMSADLYPHSDRCDVALGEDVGVDVKDYRDPSNLARKLNRGLGGLVHYRRCIVAVADRRARSGDYIERVREQLLPENQQRLEVRSVSDTIRMLKRDYRRPRGKHAR